MMKMGYTPSSTSKPLNKIKCFWRKLKGKNIIQKHYNNYLYNKSIKRTKAQRSNHVHESSNNVIKSKQYKQILKRLLFAKDLKARYNEKSIMIKIWNFI